MSRDFYFFANFFLGLLVACGIFQSIIFFQLGYQFYTLPTFFNWYLLVNLIAVVGAVFLLKYYRYKKFESAFITGIIATVATFIQVGIIYTINLLQSLYVISALVVIVCVIIYSLSLIFSEAGKRPWLKKAGVVMLAIFVVHLFTFLWNIVFPEVRTSGAFLKISQWTSLLQGIIPVGYMLNFSSEVRIIKDDRSRSTEQKFSPILVTLALVCALILTPVFGARIAGQSMRKGKLTPVARVLSERFEARSYVSEQGDTLMYRLLKPLDYDSTEKYPLMVCLHGGAGWGTDNMKQFEGSLEAQILSDPENRKKYPAFLFVPQCRPGTSWGGVPTLQPVDSLVFEIIAALESEFNIDDQRRYVMGHSLGGYGAWHFVCTRPEMFAAAIPVAGIGDAKLAKNIVDMPVWAFHGRLDRNVPVSGSRDIIEAIKKAGGDPKYTEYPYRGHDVWTQVRETPGLMDWLFAQRREQEQN